MLMDNRPLPRLPYYSASPRCPLCFKVTEHRIEMLHPQRGLLLACGACVHVAFGTRDPFKDAP